MILVLFLWLLFICSDCFSYLTSLGRRHNRTQRGPAERLFHSSSSRIRDGHEEVFVVVNGLPGPMALETAKACIDRGLKVAPVALTGPNYSPQVLEIKVRQKYKLFIHVSREQHFSLTFCYAFRRDFLPSKWILYPIRHQQSQLNC